MDRVLTGILILVICGTTVLFGGVQTIVYSLAEGLLFLAVLLLLVKQTLRGEINLPLPVWPILFVIWVLLELVPFPTALVERVSPARISEFSIAAGMPGREAWSTLSFYPHETVSALLRIMMCLSAFVLAAYLFDSRTRKSPLVSALILIGSIEVIYGIIQYLTGSQKILWYTKVYNVQEATGTYINRNHYAGLLELTLPFVLASAFHSLQSWSGGRRLATESGGSQEARPGASQLLFYMFLLAIGGIAIVFSRSRAGILAAAFSLLFVAVLAQLKAARKVWTIGVLIFLACVGGYALWIGLDPVLARFETMREPGYIQLEGRISLWKDGLRLARDFGLVGTGLGTFGVAFRSYQSALVTYFVDHAHNDYLEFAADTGLIGAALLFLPILYLLFKMIGSFLTDSRRYRRAVTLGCIGSTLALLIHSVTDFNLQIPANAIIFAVVLGIGYKAAYIERAEERKAPAPTGARTSLN